MKPTKEQYMTGSNKYESIYEALKLYERGKANAALARIRWSIPNMTMEQLKMTVTMNEMGGLMYGGRITPKGHEYYNSMISGALEMANR